MAIEILVGLGATVGGLLIITIIGLYAVVHKINKLYEDLENVDPENWKHDTDELKKK